MPRKPKAKTAMDILAEVSLQERAEKIEVEQNKVSARGERALMQMHQT